MRDLICERVALAVALCLAGTACGSGARTADGTPPAVARSAADDRATVESAIRAHWTAINGGDTATVGAQHAAGVTIIMTEAADRFAIPSPTADSLLPSLLTVKPQYVVEDLQIQLFGDVGVASFYLGGGVRLANGRLDSRRRRVTEIWVRQSDGVWKEAHHHDSVFSRL